MREPTKKQVGKYYEGGYRVVIDGVPTRLSFEPSANALALMQLDYNCTSDTECMGKAALARAQMRFPQCRYDTTYIARGWTVLPDKNENGRPYGKAARDLFYFVHENTRSAIGYPTETVAAIALAEKIMS